MTSTRQIQFSELWRYSTGLAALLLALAAFATGAIAQQTNPAGGDAPAGPIRLRQPAQTEDISALRSDQSRPQLPRTNLDAGREGPPRPAAVEQGSDFQSYVHKLPGGQNVRRFGLDLIDGLSPSSDASEYNPVVPPDYTLRAGDELVVTLWGSIDADLRLRVDRSGRISIPRVGPVMVSGVRYADLAEVISRRIGQVFKNFQISVALGQLHGMRVYVTGFVNRPGATLVSSLSTLAQALMAAGGPSVSGSLRDIQLKRGREVVARFDMYDLLLRGDRSNDLLLQADDVVLVNPVGPQVAILGSVNRPGIFEFKPGETAGDGLRMAGGLSAVADRRQLTLDRLQSGAVNSLTLIDLPGGGATPLASGDVLRAVNAAEISKPSLMQNKRVRVEGEVQRPGEYLLPPASSLSDALRAAGGTTTNAFLFAAEFTRESVRQTQQQNYERALRDFETQATSLPATRRAANSEEAAALASASAANSRLLERLRALKPTGRIVLQLSPSDTALPDLALEDGDRLLVPPRPNTVGVFGSVFSTGSYLHSPQRTVGDYLRLAGGPTRGADAASLFVIRANGSVTSSLQESGYFSRGNQIAHVTVEPGDTIFVPEELNKTTWIQDAKDWTQILYQFGIGLAGLITATK